MSAHASVPKLIVFSLAPIAVVAALAGGGFLLGRHVALRPFAERIAANDQALTLGRLVADDEARARFAPAYEDPAAALRDLESYAWVPPAVPTPFVGSAPMPGRHANAEIDARQFRRAGGIEVPKPTGVRRIFLVGGSTAFGSGAPSQDRTIAGYLEQALNAGAEAEAPRFEVVTAAHPAWTTTQERILIENRLVDLEPDLIIALSGGNDVHWGRLGRNVLWFETYSDRFLWDLARDAHAAAGGGALPTVEEVSAEAVPCRQVGDRLVRNVRLGAFALVPTGARYLFALQPNLAVTAKGLSERERGLLEREVLGKGSREYFRECYEEIRGRVGESARLGGLAFEDLSTLFDSDGADAEIFLDSYHFGDRGNARIARALGERIRAWTGGP